MKIIKTRMITFFLALVMLAGPLAAVPVKASSAQEIQTRTLMLYLDGANLETDWECATWNLTQSMNANYDENLNYIVMTGGSKEWHTPEEYLDGAEAVDAEYDQIWKLEGKREEEEHGKMKLLEPTGIEGFEKAHMAKPETLTAFIDYCYENYPADQYDLILWDHGGAFDGGYGYDERFAEDYSEISIAQMVALFEETKLIKDGKKFEIIDFDACMMSGVDVAAALAPYADYLVASAEIEPGDGQEYTSWLNALREDPGMNGFEIGKHIVDGLATFYSEEEIEEGTLSVIDLRNFTERLMPLITELDDILIREAKLTGTQNGRYNFYDELYSILTAYKYCWGEYSLYDLGTLVGSLSSPQSEMDNANDDEIDALTNAYTETALKILAILADSDGSGDDVIYSSESAVTRCSVDGYSIRGLDGAFLPPDENGFITIDPTGFNIFFGDGDLYNANSYAKSVNKAIKNITDETTITFLKKRSLAVAYYSLTAYFGRIVSELSATSEDPVTWEEVKTRVDQSQDYSFYIPSLLQMIADYDDDFASANEVETYFSQIVTQQAGEALRQDKVSVKKLVDADGFSNFYQVTIRNASSQSLMSVISMAELEVGNYESPEFEEILHTVYDDKTYDEVFPYGICFFAPKYEGTLDYYRYYEKYDDSDADIYQRVYSDTTSVWIVPEVDTYCFVLTDQDGVEHPAIIQYKDRSKMKASLPIMIRWASGDFSEARLEISFGENGWQVDGVSFHSDEERSSYPMDSEFFAGAKFATAANVPDADEKWYLNPISQFCEIDITKNGWGISLGWKKVGEFEEIVDSAQAYFVNDLYGYGIDITDLFHAANEAAKDGDVAYMIDCVDFSIAEAVYNGDASAPKVTATLNGTALTEGVDYRVLYDGSSDPGSASLVVIGIGDFYGALGMTYTIMDSLEVRVDGTEIGEENYTVDEETGAVTLTDEYVKTLAVGDHTLTVIISGAETTENFTVPAENGQGGGSPQTGDDSHIRLWIILMSVSAFGALIAGRSMTAYGKKKKFEAQ